LTQTGLGSVTDAALRRILLSEARSNDHAWSSRAPDLHRDAASSRAELLPESERPTPLADGPIERYAQRIGLVTLLAAGGLSMTPSGRRRAAQAVAVGSPRPARIGREAFAGRLGRLFASRGIVVRDPSALRRLDRVQTVVVDAAVLLTGRLVICSVEAREGSSEAARVRAADLLRNVRVGPARTGYNLSHGDWSLRSANLADPEFVGKLNPDPSEHGEILALRDRGKLTAIVRVEAELDPLCSAMMAAARKVGPVLIAGGPAVAARVRADDAVPGGSRLARSIQQLQNTGRGVALVAARNDPALAAADCGVGILTTHDRPPWGAHVLAGPGLEAAWLVLEAMTLARRASSQGARVATLGAIAGALLALMDRTPVAGRRAVTAGAAAGAANLASALWSVRSLAGRPPPVPEGLVPWHALPIDEVLRLLDVSQTGLSETAARARRTTAGAQGDHPPGLLATTVSELDTPLTAPLAAGAGISAATGSPTDAILVLSVILGSALLSASQERVAQRAMRKLRTASAIQVRLFRDGQQRLAPADDLVVGDVIALEAGDAVPADCRLLTSQRLEVDESTLTGESMPTAKDTSPTLASAVADRTSLVYGGTTVTGGSARAVVVAVGQGTEAGRNASLMIEDAPTGGVQARLSALTRSSIPLAAAAAATVLFGGLLRGRAAESVNSSVALAVAAIPEGLPFVATAAELSASHRLARHNVLVRRPRSVEAAGRVDTICFDKTGTLTEGRIQLRTVSDGRSHNEIDRLGPRHRQVVACALRASPVANEDGTFLHPTDQAVVTGAQAAGVRSDEGAPDWRTISQLPFESERGFHAVLGDTSTGHTISVKGAPEIVLPRCVAWRHNGRVKALTETDRREIDAEVDRLARRGLRVLAVATRPASPRRHFDEDRVEGLQLCGLLGLADTTRPTAAAAVQRLRRAGVKVVMLTGDHPSTAEAIGAELDLLDGGTVITGPELDLADDAMVDALVEKAAVFARVSPTHKMTVVRSLRRLGHVVAVTGDGANDAPAIRLADLGIALGDRGTDAARQAADMIVVDGRLETIADGILAGRAMWASVRDAIALLLGGNLGEILFAVGSSAISTRPALNARQILFVNLMTDLLPALTVASRAPRGVTLDALAEEGPETSLGTALTRDVARRAIATSAGTAAGWLAARFTGTPARASTVAVAALVASQLAQTALAARGDPAVLTAVGLSAAALVATVQIPGLSHFFGSRPLGPFAWSIVLGAAGAASLIATAPRMHLPGLTAALDRILAAGTPIPINGGETSHGNAN
jgi:cation-transporting ATPase I